MVGFVSVVRFPNPLDIGSQAGTLDSIAVSLSTNSIRRQDPNIYSDTETRALSRGPCLGFCCY